jgi:RND family efflux transporter MFP subunit
VKRNPARRSRALALGLVWLAIAGGCGPGNEYAAPPPPPVTVSLPELREITRFADYTGTTRAVEAVDVRARVQGFLQSIHFEPGDFVDKGTLLFIIDPEPFEVALESAQAKLAGVRAQLELTKAELERREQALETRAISELEVIQTRAQRDQARADVRSAAAAVADARLDLDYAHVKAPIEGRVGRNLVDVGALVGAGDATLLAQMVRYAPVHVYFNLSERDVLSLQKRSRSLRDAEGVAYDDREPTPIHVGLADEEGYPHEGRVDYTGLRVDPETGTFEVRGVLPNDGPPDEIMMPGLFVRVRIPVGREEQAMLVSQRALGADQGGRFVLVVGSEDVVEQRYVKVCPEIDGMAVIESGLRPDDRVVVKGVQRARPGAKVTPHTDGAAP